MALRIILVGLVSALGWELPTRQDLQRVWEKGVSYCERLRVEADRPMPDGVEAFAADPSEAKVEEIADVVESALDEPIVNHDFSKMCVIENCLDCRGGRIVTHKNETASIDRSAVSTKTTEIKIGPITIVEEGLCETTEKVAATSDSAGSDDASAKIDADFASVVDEMERRFSEDAARALGRLETSATSEVVGPQKAEAKASNPTSDSSTIASVKTVEPVVSVVPADAAAQVVNNSAIEPFDLGDDLYPGLAYELNRAGEGLSGQTNGVEPVASVDRVSQVAASAPVEKAAGEGVSSVERGSQVAASAPVEKAAAERVSSVERVSPVVEVERRIESEVATSAIPTEPTSVRPTTTTRFAMALRMTGQALEAWATFLQGPTDLASTGQVR